MTEPDPLPAHEREVRAYAADSADVILRRALTGVLAEYDAMRAELLSRPALHAGDAVQIYAAGNTRPAVVKLLGNLAGPLVVEPTEEGATAMGDELAEAERWARERAANGGKLMAPLMVEHDRLLDVEHAAALLLDACDAREAAGMTTGANTVREFLRYVRRTS